MVNHCAAAGRHDPLPLATGDNPVSGKANAIRPVDPVVADHPDQGAHGPNATSESAGFFKIPQRALNILLRIFQPVGGVNPGQPLAQRAAVGVN